MATITRYGAAFDRLAERWARLEAEHNLHHPDRGECGGVGGCVMMRAAYDLSTQMEEELETWRRKYAKVPAPKGGDPE